MLTDERICRKPQRAEVQRGWYVPRVASAKRISHGPVDDGVPIRTPPSGMARIEVWRCDRRVTDHDLGSEHPVQTHPEPSEIRVRSYCERHDLTPRMNARVGSTCAREFHLTTQDALERVLQHSGDGALIYLFGEPMEVSAVVGHHQTAPVARRHR